MPHPEKDRGPRPYACYRVLPSWPVLLISLALGVMGSAVLSSAEAATLNEIRVGNHGDYIRIVFELSDQVQYQLNQDMGPSEIAIRFLETDATISKNLETVQENCLYGVAVLQQDNQTIARLRFNPRWHTINPFTLREPDRIVLDVFCDAGTGTDGSQSESRVEAANQTPDAIPEKESEPTDSISTLVDTPPLEKETATTLVEQPSANESTTTPAAAAESQAQEPRPKINQATKPVATPTVAPWKEDPFQKYLLILLAAITGIIIILIALIVIHKRGQSSRSDVVGDDAPAGPDETMRAIDQQIKSKLMKYDDQ